MPNLSFKKVENAVKTLPMVSVIPFHVFTKPSNKSVAILMTGANASDTHVQTAKPASNIGWKFSLIKTMEASQPSDMY